MFQITIDDVFVIRDNVAISGKCVNRKDFTPTLVDDSGTEYTVFLPFIKHVIPPEADYITLELKNISDPHTLIGRTLKSIVQ